MHKKAELRSAEYIEIVKDKQPTLSLAPWVTPKTYKVRDKV